MSHTTKLISALVLAAFLLAACASAAPATENAPASEAATQAPAATEVAAPTTAPENTPETAPGATGEISFANDVMPILESRCLNCHGGQRTQEGLSVKTYEALITGSQNGPVVTPGDAANSLFVKLAAEGKMPKRGPKLTPAEVQLLTDWVNAGAPNN